MMDEDCPMSRVPPRHLGAGSDPLGVALNSALDLARMELDGARLDDEERAILDVCDEIGHVRGIAAAEVGMSETRESQRPSRRSV